MNVRNNIPSNGDAITIIDKTMLNKPTLIRNALDHFGMFLPVPNTLYIILAMPLNNKVKEIKAINIPVDSRMFSISGPSTEGKERN